MLSALQKRRQIERLRLLCATGAGLEAISPSVCAIARDLIDADSASIFWFDRGGAPAGFYHDSAPVELKDLFVTRASDLFTGSDQFSMVALIASDGPPIGQMLREGADAYFRASNVYEYLCKPLGHEHVLDVRIDYQGRGIAVIALWNPAGRPFTARDAHALEVVRENLALAVAQDVGAAAWRSRSARTSHMICDNHGQKLISIDAEAERLLQDSHLLLQGIAMQDALRNAPSFCAGLAEQLRHKSSAEIHLPTAHGRLVMSASHTQIRGNIFDGEPLMFVAVDHQSSDAVSAVEYLAVLPLTYLQKQIALFGMLNGKRSACETRFGISAESMKKQLKKIFEATDARNWGDLHKLCAQVAG